VIIGGRAVLVPGKNVDTDVLYPGIYLNIDDPELMKPYLFEGLDASLRDQLSGDTVLVVGENFGMGSSREHVPLAMKAWGVRCILGHSFARIFHRNCINLGLAVISCPLAAAASKSGSRVEIDTDSGTVEVDGSEFQAAPIPAFMLDMLAQGGLSPRAQARVARAR
jgi:3-isopropylmalate/(R)-2-methylmalate dehydratase small subunit